MTHAHGPEQTVGTRSTGRLAYHVGGSVAVGSEVNPQLLLLVSEQEERRRRKRRRVEDW